MDRGEMKKVLFVTGMDEQIEGIVKQTNVNLENAMIIKRYGPLKLQPFGDLMRDIIIAVYKENVEEIFIVAAKDNPKKIDDIYNEFVDNKGLQEKIQTLEYLFKHSIPQFPEEKISEWLEGGGALTDEVEYSIDSIRHHPLMPSSVKVSGLYIDMENGRLIETEIS